EGLSQIALAANTTTRVSVTMIGSRTDAAGAARETHDLLVRTDGTGIVGTTIADWSDYQTPPDGAGLGTFTDAGWTVQFQVAGLVLRIHCIGAGGEDVSYAALVEFSSLGGF